MKFAEVLKKLTEIRKLEIIRMGHPKYHSLLDKTKLVNCITEKTKAEIKSLILTA